MSKTEWEKKCLEYHVGGKTGTLLKKPCDTAEELSMAYTPGVAVPCLEIEKDVSLAYKYTNKGNLVAVVSDGTAVLGLGDIGHLAGKPVMEGKGVLFKKFADVDCVDIELNVKDTEDIIKVTAAIADSFGGINLEDIKAPKCFEIEDRLKEICNVPVFHDDQHGTAIISTAGLINALELSGKKAEDLKIVVVGAGAAGTACAKMYKNLGVKHISMIDSKGVIYKGRDGLNKYKEELAIQTDDRTLSDAMKGADMVLGLSGPRIITQDMVKSMGDNPIIYACANPTPEITPEEVLAVRSDVMMGTGRSDYPNQINNVLGFPFIFRGALDVRATKITENMKLAAAKALAALAKEPVPEYVKAAYPHRDDMEYGKNYIIPSPFDKRIAVFESYAVAKAAIEDGVATVENFDLEQYKKDLENKFLS
jgi:malate dehydrogenase (oxaloacetate-decarboxylating)(NADP+)